MAKDKLCTLTDAVKMVQDGDIVAFGGMIESRRPMAAMFEIIRQQKRNLIVTSSLSLEDILASAGCVGGVRGCYTHMGIAGKAHGVHRRIQEGSLIVDDIGHIDCQMQVLGAGYGLPFIASQYCIGSDITNPALDRSEDLRKIARNKDKIAPKKYIFQKNPFNEEETVVMLPTIRPDIAFLHVAQATPSGTCRFNGTSGFDVNIGFAADIVIVTADEIVSEEYLRRDPNRNMLPSTMVTAVVDCPWGAHPGINQGYYDYDLAFVGAYRKAAETEEGYKEWEKEWILDVGSHEGYVNKLGAARLQKLKSVEPFGFKPRTPISSFTK